VALQWIRAKKRIVARFESNNNEDNNGDDRGSLSLVHASHSGLRVHDANVCVVLQHEI